MPEYLLQSGVGEIAGQHYLPSQVDDITWGWLPNRDYKPVLEVASGQTVTIDTVSHEGILEDQGRDPTRYLAQYGVAAAQILLDARDIAANESLHRDNAGPHVVTGPISVTGAKAGDLLKVEILELSPRAPYGFISNRHGYGALVGEFPEHPDSEPVRALDRIASAGTISHFCSLDSGPDGPRATIGEHFGRSVSFPINPFLGLMGVAPDTSEPVHSVPPGPHGGNIDIKETVIGSTVYLPVKVAGALFYVGDPHYAQGNGEVALTALEAPLRATIRLSVISGSQVAGVIGSVREPFIETATHWIPSGMDPDLNVAVQNCVRNAVLFLNTRLSVPRDVALAYLSAAADFEISQVVDIVKGVHCMIRKTDFATWI